jgi:hypothetical protein
MVELQIVVQGDAGSDGSKHDDDKERQHQRELGNDGSPVASPVPRVHRHTRKHALSIGILPMFLRSVSPARRDS